MPSLKDALTGPRPLVGTFVKTPSLDVIEVLILAGLDFAVLDAEHAPWGRAEISAACAVARAHGFPLLVRPPAATPDAVLTALDAGAVGIMAPHVRGGDDAAALARSARFGAGGRGYAGSSRWAGYGTRTMPELLEQSRRETVVIAQIEDPEAVEAADAVAGTEGIDGVFLGPADLTVAYGETTPDNAPLAQATATVGAAVARHGKAYWTWAPTAERATALIQQGFGGFCVASDHAWMLAGARATVAALR